MTVDDAWRPDTVWRHRLGAGLPAEKVYHEPDERFWLGGRPHPQRQVRDHRARVSAVTSEMRYADADRRRTPSSPACCRAAKVVEYSVEHAVVGGEDRFLILHNDGAENFTLVEAPVSDPTDHAHAHRAPRRRPARRRRRVRRPPGGQLPPRGAAANPAVAHLRATASTAQPEEITFDSELMSAGLARQPQLGLAEAADRRDVVRHPGAHLRPRPRHR